MPKYIIHMGICGFGNQLLGFKEACIIAKHTNRIMVEPIFIPHGSIRNKCEKYYKFADIFDINNFNSKIECVNIEKISHIKINNIYNIRNDNEKSITDPYYNFQKDYYNISDIKSNRLNNKFLQSYDDFSELNKIEDDILVLLGTFNTIKLNTCSKNGCLNPECGFNETFLNDYNKISKALIFNNNINTITNTILDNLNLIPNEYCTFHLRAQDTCENTLFKDSYNDYDESIVYQSIVNYLFENNKQNLINKIFVCLPPQALKIIDLKIFNSNKIHILDHSKYNYDPFILSIIELNICEQSSVLIYSPTNTPYMNKIHTRSSFVLHTMDLRRINNINISDTCIDKIYNKIDIENIKIINKSNKKIISTSLYGNKDIYNYGLLLNDALNKLILPDWILRVYIDNTTNMNFISKVKNNNNIEIIKINTLVGTMYHRFFPISDPNVEIFISRDLDSIISFYEKAMVSEWLNTDKQLHLIHEILPGHRHIIMGGMFGFKNIHKSTNNIETSINPIDKNKKFYYEPWKDYCNVSYNNDIIIISPHNNYNSYAKVMKIFKKDFENFYNGEKITCLWDNKEQLVVQKINNDIKVSHKSRDCYFRCIDYNKDNNNTFNFYSSIINYYLQASRTSFFYGDDQNFIKEYFKKYLNKHNCLDHNNTTINYDYSKKFTSEYTPISTILKNENDYYVGHRVNTKKLYIDNIQ